MSALFVFIWLYFTAAGEFILESEPSCSDGSLVYSCTTSNSFFLSWRFQPSGVREGIANGDSSPQAVLVGSSTVLLTIVSSSTSSISVTATVAYSDAVELNGTSVSCGTDTLVINISDVTLNLPASLRIHQKENIVVIDPRPYIIGVIYNVTSVNNLIKDGIFNGSGILVMRSNLAINLSFTCITTSITFNLGECIFRDYNENFTYTLFYEDNWTITCFNTSYEISDIACMTAGNWSVPNPCLASSSTTKEDEITDSSFIFSTTGSSISERHSNCGNIIVYLVAPMVTIIFALIVNTVVMAICFCQKGKRNMEALNNIALSNTVSVQRGKNKGQEGHVINLVDNVAYEYIATK